MKIHLCQNILRTNMQNNNSFTPETSSDTDNSFSIPLYQRLFEWKETQIERLLNDLKESYENQKRPYYIGMLTATQENALVDGQQRFTLMMLMGIVFKEFYSGWNSFICKDDKNPRLGFDTRPEDYEYLKDLIDPIDDKQPQHINSNMEAGRECIEEWLNNNFEKDKESFCEYVYKNLCFFISYLPNNYTGKELNQYFERMNTAGRNLENHEILKIFCLQKLKSDKDKATQIWNLVSQMDNDIIDFSKYKGEENSQLLFNYLLNNIDQETQQEADTETRTTILDIIENGTKNDKKYAKQKESHRIFSFSEFLLLTLFITLTTTSNPEDLNLSDFNDASKLLTTFEKYTTKDKDKDFAWYEIFFNNLLKFRRFLDYFVIKKPDEQWNYEIECGDDNIDKRKLIQYQAMLYSDGQNPIWWIAEYFKKIMEQMEQKSIPSCRDLLDFLKKLNKDKLPELGSLTYDNRYAIRLNHWLRLLDYYLWEKNEDEESQNKDAKISEFKFRRGSLSVEHLHPQNQNKETPWESADINSFGNLFLISQSFNSAQNNDSATAKFDTIKKRIESKGHIESIKLYKAYQLWKENNKEWDKDIMQQHGKDMHDILKKHNDLLSY